MPRVARRENRVGAGLDRHAPGLARGGIRQLGAEGLDGEPPTEGHGVTRVEHEIQQHLRQLAGVGLDETGGRAEAQLERRLCAEGAPEHEVEATDRLVEIEYPWTQHLAAAEREKLTRDRR